MCGGSLVAVEVAVEESWVARLLLLGVKHLHEQRLWGGAAVEVSVEQVVFAPLADDVDLWQDRQQVGELVLQKKSDKDNYTGYY